MPTLFIRTYGCQQNVADSERIRGLLEECGCISTDDENTADIVLFNTCAVREHAEDRVFGNVGQLKANKAERPEMMILLGGCMVHQVSVQTKIKKSYPYVDILFNTNELASIPSLILRRLKTDKRVLDAECAEYTLNEELPVKRDGLACRAYIPIMYGCNNFCTYCIVPYVRGRERSRSPEAIEKEFRDCVAAGYKDIMLLGQNVNSYGVGLEGDMDFPKLLKRFNDVEGDFTIRFMSSHPKNATRELFDTIAECKKVSRHIHLPVQSGSNRVLKAMNRHYTVEEYLSLIDYARSVIPGVYFTSDIIVGFPGETEAEYEETVDLIRKADFYSIFSFIYSKRTGTVAADMEDETPHRVKAERLNRLNEIQREVTDRLDAEMVGREQRGLCIGNLGDNKSEIRLDNNAEVTVDGTLEVNTYCDMIVTGSINKRLYGKVIEK